MANPLPTGVKTHHGTICFGLGVLGHTDPVEYGGPVMLGILSTVLGVKAYARQQG